MEDNVGTGHLEESTLATWSGQSEQRCASTQSSEDPRTPGVIVSLASEESKQGFEMDNN